ncbi:MAG: hypothetical protein HQK50_06550 [Oligoflexia bacterium]|nr:hypothetical protein [Oligoflexia bacterium]MBF0365212.1 hypothetical protein [Oligoflexia bacterium]
MKTIFKAFSSLLLVFILYCNQIVLPTISISPQGFHFAFGIAFQEASATVVPSGTPSSQNICDNIDQAHRKDCQEYSVQEGSVFTYKGNSDELNIGNEDTRAYLWMIYVMQTVISTLISFIFMACPSFMARTWTASAFLAASLVPIVGDTLIFLKMKNLMKKLSEEVKVLLSENGGEQFSQSAPLQAYRKALADTRTLVIHKRNLYYASMGFFILAIAMAVAEVAYIASTFGLTLAMFTEPLCPAKAPTISGTAIALTGTMCAVGAISRSVSFGFFGLAEATTPMTKPDPSKTTSDPKLAIINQISKHLSPLLQFDEQTITKIALQISPIPNAMASEKDNSISKLYSGLGLGMGLTLCVVLVFIAKLAPIVAVKMSLPGVRIAVGVIGAVIMGVAAGVFVQNTIDRLEKRVSVLDAIIAEMDKNNQKALPVSNTSQKIVDPIRTLHSEANPEINPNLIPSNNNADTSPLPGTIFDDLSKVSCGTSGSEICFNSANNQTQQDLLSFQRNGNSVAGGVGLAASSSYADNEAKRFMSGNGTNADTKALFNHALSLMKDNKKRLANATKDAAKNANTKTLDNSNKDNKAKLPDDAMAAGTESAKRFFSDAQKSFKNLTNELGMDAINKEADAQLLGNIDAKDSNYENMLKGKIDPSADRVMASTSTDSNEKEASAIDNSNLEQSTSEEKIQADSSKQYDFGKNDIHSNSERSLWDIITSRYKKTAYPKFLKKKQ